MIKVLDDGEWLLELCPKAYCSDAVMRTAYKFTDRCYIRVHPVACGGVDILQVYFKPKEVETGDDCIRSIVDDFCNELIDEQIRVTSERDFGNIRDLLVKQAFYPISKG